MHPLCPLKPFWGWGTVRQISMCSPTLETGDFLRLALRICTRDLSSGSGMYISWSRRPGRSMAGSIMSGLLVAPMMNTFFFELIPSISVNSWLITRSAAPPPSPTFPPRAFAMESNSSKNSTHGAADRAYKMLNSKQI